jgi:serine protease Do
MKEKTLYISTIILSLFLGIMGTIVVINYMPKKSDNKKIQEVLKEVNITETNTLKAAIDKIYDAVVLVETYNNNTEISSGTGFIYKKDEKQGYIITNHHVIENGNKYKITLIDGEEIDAKLLGSDEYSDIAVLAIDQEPIKQIAQLGNSSESEIGDTVFAVGSPLGKEYMGTVTKGILSGKDRTVTVNSTNSSTMVEVLQTDAAINPGNSGGPLVNINGEVIGVTSMKLVKDEIEGMGFAIPIEIVNTLIERLENGEKIDRPLLGVEMTDIKNTYYLYRKGIIIPEEIEKGVVVTNSIENYPASKAGIKKGDILLKINDIEIEDSAHLRYILYKYEVGDKITIKYMRNNKIDEAVITLDKKAE